MRPDPCLRPDPRSRPAVLAVLGTLVLAGLLAGPAQALWSGTGSGLGAGSTAPNSLALTLTPGTPGSALVPGSSADVTVALGNPNPAPVHVTSLQLDPAQGTGGYGVDAGHSACGLGSLHLTASSTSWDVPARVGATNGSLAVTLAGALAMDVGADNACQGATFSVYLTAVP